MYEISHSYIIDANQVYAAGISNGGMMAYNLACATPTSNFLSAIAVIAGCATFDSCNGRYSVHVTMRSQDISYSCIILMIVSVFGVLCLKQKVSENQS